jgi:hypothetical protein
MRHCTVCFQFILTTGKGYVGALGRLIIWCPFKKMISNLFGLRGGWETFQRARAPIVDNIRRDSCGYGNLSYLAPFHRLFQRRLSAPYWLAPKAAVRLARPLVRRILYRLDIQGCGCNATETRKNISEEFVLIPCTVHLLLFCTMTNTCTIISQIIIFLL